MDRVYIDVGQEAEDNPLRVFPGAGADYTLELIHRCGAGTAPAIGAADAARAGRREGGCWLLTAPWVPWAGSCAQAHALELLLLWCSAGWGCCLVSSKCSSCIELLLAAAVREGSRLRSMAAMHRGQSGASLSTTPVWHACFSKGVHVLLLQERPARPGRVEPAHADARPQPVQALRRALQRRHRAPRYVSQKCALNMQVCFGYAIVYPTCTCNPGLLQKAAP